MPRPELPVRPVAASDADSAAAGMAVELSREQRSARLAFRAFATEHIVPLAADWDRLARVSDAAIAALRDRGWLGAPLPSQRGGGGMEPVTYGLLTEEIGRGCSSLRSLLTVHDMVTLTLARWGGETLVAEWLPALGSGQRLGALALSEPEVGSDAAAVRTTARREGGDWVLDGVKRWITFGQLADVFLVFARVGAASATAGGGVAAFLVPADSPGLRRRPIEGVVGTRASLLAEIRFAGCRIPQHHLVGRVGFGISHIAATALDHGRYSVAWGSVGIAQACLTATLDYTAQREQYGAPLDSHQLVQAKLTEMIVGVRAARLLCYRAGHQRRQGDPGASGETLIAKYFASRTAVRAARDAVQLHGANGLSDRYPVERFQRDAQVTEIIEGSTQILQGLIPRYPIEEL